MLAIHHFILHPFEHEINSYIFFIPGFTHYFSTFYSYPYYKRKSYLLTTFCHFPFVLIINDGLDQLVIFIKHLQLNEPLHWMYDKYGHLGLDLNGHLGRSQMVNGGLLRLVMSHGLKSSPWSTH